MLLLLDFQDRSILERPFHHIGVISRALDELAALQCRPELAEGLQFNEVPDIAEGGFNDSRLAHEVGSGDLVGHCVVT